MIVLGLHGGFDPESEVAPQSYQNHDSAAILVDDMRVIAGVEEERLNRIKHSNAFPRLSARACLAMAQLDIRDVERIAYTQPRSHFGKDALLRSFFSPTTRWRNDVDQAALPLIREFGIDIAAKLRFVPHHLAHLWSAFGCCDFETSLVVSLDGGGPAAAGLGKDYGMIALGAGSSLTVIRTLTGPQESLGLFYANLIHLLGYRLFDEYKVMGLAPYGDPTRFRSLFSSLYSLEAEGRIVIANHAKVLSTLGSAGLLHTLRRAGEPLRQQHFDLAAGIQWSFEEMYFHILRFFRTHTDMPRLCLAGGAALNCVANGKLAAAGLFEEVFVQPAPHDAGCAWGAALAVFDEQVRVRRAKLKHVFFGGRVGDETQIAAGLVKWRDLVIHATEAHVARSTAERIASGQVVGWVQGRSEFGPRALGNRSILADPRPMTSRDRINEIVKKRESYRPFAPVVQAEYLEEFFEIPVPRPDYSFMSFTALVRQQYREALRAVTHIDGSARVQSVTFEQNAELWRLLDEFAKLTGFPMLLNTSFNNDCEPIVDSLDDAVNSLLTTRIDVLVVGNCVVSRRAQYRNDRSWALTLIPSVPFGRRLSFGWRYEGGDSHRLLYSLEPAEVSGPTVMDPFLYQRPVEISGKMHRILGRSDGRATFEELIADAGLESETASIIEELHHLWERRAINVIPREEYESAESELAENGEQ